MTADPCQNAVRAPCRQEPELEAAWVGGGALRRRANHRPSHDCWPSPHREPREPFRTSRTSRILPPDTSAIGTLDLAQAPLSWKSGGNARKAEGIGNINRMFSVGCLVASGTVRHMRRRKRATTSAKVRFLAAGRGAKRRPCSQIPPLGQLQGTATTDSPGSGVPAQGLSQQRIMSFPLTSAQ